MFLRAHTCLCSLDGFRLFTGIKADSLITPPVRIYQTEIKLRWDLGEMKVLRTQGDLDKIEVGCKDQAGQGSF